jgi:hypothetical protein
MNLALMIAPCHPLGHSPWITMLSHTTLNVCLVGGTSKAVAHGGQDTKLVSPKHI